MNVAAVRSINVVRPSEPLLLRDGAVAEVRDGALELRNAEGRLLIRYLDGNAEISAPDGDLRLAAPHGRVVVASGSDVCIEAERDITHRAGRNLELRSRTVIALMDQVEVAARSVTTTAERVVTEARQWELVAERVVQKSRESVREVAGLAEERLGRLRTLVQQGF